MIDVLITTVIKYVVAAYRFVVTHWRTSLFICVLAGGALLFINWWMHNIIIDISVNDTTKGSDPRLYINKGYELEEIGSPGIHIIPRNTQGIVAQNGANIRTQTPMNVPWYSLLVTQEISLQRDKNATKVAYQSTIDNPCGAYDRTHDRLLQYRCQSPNTVVYYNASDSYPWAIETLASNTLFTATPVMPYMNGLIGIYYPSSGSENSIAILHPDGKVQLRQLPDNISTINSVNGASIVTDRQSWDNSNFIYISANGTVYLGNPDESDQAFVNYKQIDAPKEYNPEKQQTLCSLKGDSAICYRGPRNYTADGPTTDDLRGITSEIVTIDIKTALLKRYPLKGAPLISLSSIEMTKDGQLYGLDDKKIIAFKKEGEGYHTRAIAFNVDSLAIADKVLFIQNNGVFTVDPTTDDSYQIFYSHNIKPHQLITSGNDVFILGKSVNSDSTTYAWKLNDEEDLNYGKRLIDLLPSFPHSLVYGDVDLVGDKINITVPSSRDATAKSIEDKKQSTLNYLELLGVDLSNLKIVN